MVLSPLRLSILRKIEAYCEDFHVSTDKFGRLSVQDPKLVPRLRSGKNVCLHRIESALGFVDGERHAADISRQITGQPE
jgi:hypothetical protein